MMINRLRVKCVLLAIIAAFTKTNASDDIEPPNIVILFADNLGYEDVSFFQSKNTRGRHTNTPNIDTIGLEGMKFSNWNSAASLCSASRSSLLTGKYPVKTGTYPRVFHPDAVYGLLPRETTLAEFLKEEGYATSIVGKWHLGQREMFLPTNQGFDSWTGIPYHMSGGSLDNHTCYADQDGTMWLPLYQDNSIIEQPVQLDILADRYASVATDFIRQNADRRPFFLYMAFSHVHQLCAPRDMPEQKFCQWGSMSNATFSSAVEEMDWIAGKILEVLDTSGVSNNTFVLFTSDNGPWVAEQACSGSKGPFEGKWLQDNVDPTCVACPHDYRPNHSIERPWRCTLSGTSFHLDGVPCGEDTGLGSVWEANLRMPALARFPGRIAPKSETMAMVSTLDVVPTILSLIGKKIPDDVDGVDISEILFGSQEGIQDDRVLFFWRDGFSEGPLGPPYGRFDVAAVKLGRIKAWFWTKSAHYNKDIEEYHDPPLLFDVIADPAESIPLDPADYREVIQSIIHLTKQHKESIDWTRPLALATDPKYLPCVDRFTGCRTNDQVDIV